MHAFELWERRHLVADNLSSRRSHGATARVSRSTPSIEALNTTHPTGSPLNNMPSPGGFQIMEPICHSFVCIIWPHSTELELIDDCSLRLLSPFLVTYARQAVRELRRHF
jgi:hypothetical protein